MAGGENGQGTINSFTAGPFKPLLTSRPDLLIMENVLTCVRCDSEALENRTDRWQNSGLLCLHCGKFYSIKYQNMQGQALHTSAQLNLLLRCIRNGYSLNHAARKSGFSSAMACEYYYRIIHVLAETQPLCPCGKPNTHNGICAWRAVNDPVCFEAVQKRVARALGKGDSRRTIGVVWRSEPGIVLVRGERCKERGCVFGVADPISGLCAQHEHFFDYSESLTDNAFGFEELGIGSKYNWDNERSAPLSIVGVKDFLNPRLYMQDRHGNFKSDV